MSTVLLFGSNVAAFTIIKCLKKYVDRVVVLGHDCEQMGAVTADEFKKINYRDINTTLSAIEGEKNIVGCIPGGHDLAFLAYSLYKDHLDNNGTQNKYEFIFEQIHNKLLFRNLLKQINPRRCPKYIDVHDLNYLKNNKDIYPMLFKPEHAGGGRGIQLVKSYEDIALNGIMANNNKRGVLEEVIIGVDYSISIWLKNSNIIGYFADREMSFLNTYKISSSITSNKINDFIEDNNILTELSETIAMMGIKDGFVHCQIRITNPKIWYIIEITLRMPGDCYPLVSEIFGNFDYTELYVESFLPNIIKNINNNQNFIKANFPKNRLYGRVCLRKGDVLIDDLIPVFEINSHLANIKDGYKIIFYQQLKNIENYEMSNNLQLLKENNA